MSTTKKWLLASALLILLGIVMCGLCACAIGGDLKKLDTGDYVTNTHEIPDDFYNISVESDTADVKFVVTDGVCKIVCHEQKKETHIVSIEDGTLTIKRNDQRKWYDYIGGFNFDNPSITVYLPDSDYGTLDIDISTGDVELPEELKLASASITVSTGDVHCDATASGTVSIVTSTGDIKCTSSADNLTLKSSTGDITVSDLSTGALNIKVSTGKATATNVSCTADISITVSTGKSYLTDITCKNFTTTGNTGDITLSGVIASDNISIQRSTGDVIFDGCDGGNITVKTSTGDVKGTLLSGKAFDVHADKATYPQSTPGNGSCTITTSTGEVKISIK